jgi:hypothetical protein
MKSTVKESKNASFLCWGKFREKFSLLVGLPFTAGRLAIGAKSVIKDKENVPPFGRPAESVFKLMTWTHW